MSQAGSHARYTVSAVTDNVFSSRDGELLADVYLPQGCRERVPVILWLHGGGWRVGDRKLAPDLSRFFAERGFAMISIDYRLSAQATFPAQVIDVKTAVRWVRRSTAQFRFDASRIGLWGSSAGGHLAACAALSKEDQFTNGEHAEFSSGVQAVVEGYGPMDFSRMDADRPMVLADSSDPETRAVAKQNRTGDADSFESLLIGSPVSTSPEAVQRANPLTYARGGSPPFLIMHGKTDPLVPWQQSWLLFDALSSVGNDATLALVENLGHGFLNNSKFETFEQGTLDWHVSAGSLFDHNAWSSRLTYDTIEAFFRRYL